MDAVRYWGQALVEDPDRVGKTTTVGMDESKFLASRRRELTRWAGAICDIDRRMVIDVVEGRQGPDLARWLDRQSEQWCQGVGVTVTGLHEPFRRALAARLTDATAVVDPFHVVGSAPGSRTAAAAGSNATLLATGATRATRSTGAASCSPWPPNASTMPAPPGLRGLLSAGDPDGEVYEAWAVKEGIRDFYTLWDAPTSPAGGWSS